jgi:hypothetical protein
MFMRHLGSFLLVLVFAVSCSAQSGSYGLMQDANKIDIPFEYRNGLIIVDVTFNYFFPLKFIFDTGAENTILARKEITDLIQVPYEREFTVLGSDLKTELKAYLVRNIHFVISEKGVIPKHSLLVLEEDYFRFEEIAGLEIHGILGADVFRGMVVQINYERRLITLMRKHKFSPPRNYEKVPIEVFRNKAYLQTELSIQPGAPRSVKLLLDSGAMLSLLLTMDDSTGLTLPPDVLTGQLGAGLGGFIEGYLGRVAKINFGETECREILTNFMEVPENADTTVLNRRNGIIGNKLLRRFHLIIDYPGEVLYFRPNKSFDKEDEFDKSGLVTIAADIRLNKFLIHDVLEASPAQEAGLRKGDFIVRLNGWPASFLTLEQINRKLRKKEGKRIRMVIKRNGERLKFRFQLRKLI